jgi:lipopolysaccharide transport system ATP-binding protein
MKRTEIDGKFDEIVAFSEVEKFIDTPVKHYSSGMYLRLAFAVAAHLEPDILIVDEVLAVGDARFQRKCLNKMEDVGNVGRTVLFVSHNMPAITRLCKRAILLEGGDLVQDGPAHQVVSYYLNSGQRMIAERIWPKSSTAPGNEIVRLQSVRVKTESDEVVDAVDIRKPVGIEMVYDVLESGRLLLPYYHFFNEEGVLVFEVPDQGFEWRRRPRPKGRYTSIAWIPGNFLSEGMHFVHTAIMTPSPEQWHFYDRDTVAFNVIDGFEGDSARGDYAGRMTSAVRPMLKWNTCSSPAGREDNEIGS